MKIPERASHSLYYSSAVPRIRCKISLRDYCSHRSAGSSQPTAKHIRCKTWRCRDSLFCTSRSASGRPCPEQAARVSRQSLRSSKRGLRTPNERRYALGGGRGMSGDDCTHSLLGRHTIKPSVRRYLLTLAVWSAASTAMLIAFSASRSLASDKHGASLSQRNSGLVKLAAEKFYRPDKVRSFCARVRRCVLHQPRRVRLLWRHCRSEGHVQRPEECRPMDCGSQPEGISDQMARRRPFREQSDRS